MTRLRAAALYSPIDACAVSPRRNADHDFML